MTRAIPAERDDAATQVGAGDIDTGRNKLNGRKRDLLVLLGFVLVAAWLTHGLWPDPETRTLALNPADQILYEWFLSYDTHFWTGDFSLLSDRLNATDGVNLLANTTVIALGALFAPITLIFGAATTFSLIVGLNLAATAFAWYLFFAKTLRASRTAAVIGGLFCGFAPGMISQSNSHLHITAQWLIPLMLWCVVAGARMAEERLLPTRRFIGVAVLFGLLVVVQVFIGEETLFLTAVALAIFTIVYLLMNRPTRSVLARYAAGLVISVGVAIPLLMYPLWHQFSGPGSVPNGVFSADYFSADLASFVAVSPMSLAGSEVSASLTTGAAEYNTFLGWPLVLVFLALVVWMRRQALVVASAITALVMAALSLGPTVVIDHDRTGFPGLYRLLRWIPVLDGALPMRFALAIIPLIAVVLVLAWDRAAESVLDRTLFGVPVAIGLALVPLTPLPLPATDRPAVPRFYSEGHWRECAKPGDVLVTVPLPTPPEPEPMRYATAADTAFALPEGFFIGPYGPNGHATMGTWKRPTSAMMAEVAKTGQPATVDGKMRDQAREDLAEWNAACVVLTPQRNYEQLRQTMEELLGPGTQVSDALIWRRSW